SSFLKDSAWPILAGNKNPANRSGGDDAKIITRFDDTVNVMTPTRRTATTLITGLLLAAALVYAGLAQPRPAFDPLAGLLFTVLFLFTDALAIPVGVGYVNLDAAVAVGALLVMGPFAAALMALIGSSVNIGVRWAFP